MWGPFRPRPGGHAPEEVSVKRIVVLAAMIALAGAVSAQAQIAGGPHDFSAGSALRNSNGTVNGQTCVFCHTPHGGSTNIPLWNRSNPTGAYEVYSSSTMDAAAPTAATIQSSVSGACLSCHDGSVAIDVLTNIGGSAKAAGWVVFTAKGTAKAQYSNSGGGQANLMSGGLAFMGTDLRNDHPVNITYQTAFAAGEFVAHTNPTGSKIVVTDLPLYGSSTATATVECASCHNPHNNTNGSFLRKSNQGSALCLTCHIK